MRTSRREGGFTLIEMIVVLAVVGTLAALIAPRIFPYIDEAKLTKAQLDVNAIAAGITKFYKDTGRWPFEQDGTSSAAYAAASDAAVLTSNSACDDGTGIAAATPCDANAPTDATTGTTWALATAKGDSLHDQLVYNSPMAGIPGDAYTMSGKKAWNGPYLFNIATMDPWGHSYLVNIAGARPDEEGAATQKWVIAISAGPDGELDTKNGVVWTNRGSDIAPADDDIIAVIK